MAVLLVAIAAFGFWADDALGEPQTVRVEIDGKNAGPAISPLLFGHNVEITRRGVWRGLSAEMVANRKFAAVENGLPKRWSAIPDASRVKMDGNTVFAGKQSVRVETPNGGPFCGISQQHEALAFRKEKRYIVRLWVKCEGSATVLARITDAAGKRVLFENPWPVKAGDWQLIAAEFIAPASGENNRLEIGSKTPGAVWIGAVSIQPADALHGMRPDVVELLKAIRPGCLRYPGGCCAEFYRWQDGLAPADRRPPIGPTGLSFLMPETDDYDMYDIGTDEFIALCRQVGCEPLITARVSENSPEDAAAWVEYCNGGRETKWGKVRAERGHPEPYGVKYWFVGNELYFFGRGVAKTADGCASQSRLFAAAMKKADPSIRLIGCTSLSAAWDKPLLAQAGAMLDLGSAHYYLLDHLKVSGDAGNQSIAKAPTQMLRPFLLEGRKSVETLAPAGRRLGIAFDEWNLMWGQRGSVPMGLYVAGVLNLLCREADTLGIDLACYFMPINEGVIQVEPSTARLDTAGVVFELFKAHQGNRLLRTPPTAGDADVDLCASATPDGNRLCVTAINRNLSEERTLEIVLRNAAVPDKATVRCLVPRAVKFEQRTFERRDEQLPVAADKRLAVKLPKGCIARIDLGSP
jgi:alpha-N-arabinofuranosidase